MSFLLPSNTYLQGYLHRGFFSQIQLGGRKQFGKDTKPPTHHHSLVLRGVLHGGEVVPHLWNPFSYLLLKHLLLQVTLGACCTVVFLTHCRRQAALMFERSQPPQSLNNQKFWEDASCTLRHETGQGQTWCGEKTSMVSGKQVSQDSMQSLSCFHSGATTKNTAVQKNKTEDKQQMLSDLCSRLYPLNRDYFEIRARNGGQGNHKNGTGMVQDTHSASESCLQ